MPPGVSSVSKAMTVSSMHSCNPLCLTWSWANLSLLWLSMLQSVVRPERQIHSALVTHSISYCRALAWRSPCLPLPGHFHATRSRWALPKCPFSFCKWTQKKAPLMKKLFALLTFLYHPHQGSPLPIFQLALCHYSILRLIQHCRSPPVTFTLSFPHVTQGIILCFWFQKHNLQEAKVN